MRPYDDYDAARDMDTVNNGGCSGTSYVGPDGARENDVEDAIDRLEKEYELTLRGDWVRRDE